MRRFFNRFFNIVKIEMLIIPRMLTGDAPEIFGENLVGLEILIDT